MSKEEVGDLRAKRVRRKVWLHDRFQERDECGRDGFSKELVTLLCSGFERVNGTTSARIEKEK